MVQTGSADGVIAVQALWQPLLTPGAEAQSKALVQYRGASGSKSVVVNMQELDSEQCANPGTNATTPLLLKQEQIAKIVTSLLTLPSVL